MAESLFISDLHLSDERPATTELFDSFMRGRARRATDLYLLGDVFDVWIGDDDPAAVRAVVERSIHDLGTHGTRVYFMRGNRDLLIDEAFAQRTGCTLLEDPTRIVLFGVPTLLAHGDRLCTADEEHQAHLAVADAPEWKQALLARPLQERKAICRQYRRISTARKRQKDPQAMEVQQDAVDAILRSHGAYRLIHGHTHRPLVDQFLLDGRPAQRFVLPPWEEQGGVLCWDRSGYRVEPITAGAPPETLSG